ncbi:hypothetical protein [uncultured Corynebacterium sp.]|uniref:hypothetical protein n=1 Tax=uncultured Corynebacterium sp. TaxID=159447 RepID=UPI0025CD07B3|nr:hypothetical protein [uncultured Corynebacterium sp.]
MPGDDSGIIRGDAPGPWRVEGGSRGRVLYDGTGAALARDWRVTANGITGRSFTVSSPEQWWRVRSVGLTVSHLIVSGPGGELSLNRDDGRRGRDIVDVGERRLIARSKSTSDDIVVEVVGGSPDAAGVDADLLAAAALACAHVDGPGKLMI